MNNSEQYVAAEVVGEEEEGAHAPSPWARRAELVFVALILTGLAAALAWRFVPAYGEPDTDGYLWLARRLAAMEPLSDDGRDPFLHHGHVWVENGDGRVTPKYTLGFPVLLAAGYLFGGETGFFLVNPLFHWLTALGAYLLFRRWMGRPARVIALFAVAFHPILFAYTQTLLAHTTNTCLLVWGFLFLDRFWDQRGVRDAALGGVLLGLAATVRPASALAGLALLAPLARGLWDWRKDSAACRKDEGGASALAWMAALYLLPLAAMALVNARLFDAPWSTGYALSGEQAAFSPETLTRFFWHDIHNMTRWVLSLYLPLGLLGILLAPKPGKAWMRFMWVVPVGLLYMAYYWKAHGTMWARFFLYAVPTLVGGTYALLDRAGAGAWRKAAVLLLVALFCGGWVARPNGAWFYNLLRDRQENYLHTATFLAERVPDDAVLFVDQAWENDLPARRRYTVYPLQRFETWYPRRAFRETPGERGGIRMQPRRRERLVAFYQNHTRDHLAALLREKIHRFLAEGRRPYFLIDARQEQRETRHLGDAYRLESVGEWTQTFYRRGTVRFVLYEVVPAR